MPYLLEGIIAGVVVFFALLGVMILFIESIDIRISIGIIFLLIALIVLFFFIGDVLFIAACVAIATIAALVGNHIIENLSL